MVIGISPSGRGSSCYCSSVADRVGCFTLTMSKYLYPKVYYGSNPIPLHCSLLPSINDCIPIDILFLNIVVLNLFGHVLIVTTQLIKLLHYPLFPVVIVLHFF